MEEKSAYTQKRVSKKRNRGQVSRQPGGIGGIGRGTKVIQKKFSGGPGRKDLSINKPGPRKKKRFAFRKGRIFNQKKTDHTGGQPEGGAKTKGNTMPPS